jgi:predicted Zn-dependent protease
LRRRLEDLEANRRRAAIRLQPPPQTFSEIDTSMSLTRRQKLEALLSESPNDPFLIYGLAMDDWGAGRAEPALAGLRQVLQVDPDYVAAYLQQGQILAASSRPAEAVEILKVGIDVANRIGDAHAASEMAGLAQSLA